MKDHRAFDPRALDVAAFSRGGGVLSGAWPLAEMGRLCEGLAAVPDTAAAWSAQGRTVPVAGGEPEVWVDLQAHADVPLLCQRCLQPMVVPLAVARPFRFVRSEDEAAALDDESEEDVLVLEPRLDLHGLVEDELILALPLVPRHADAECAPLAAAAAPDDEAAPHPFAALAALRDRPGPARGTPDDAEAGGSGPAAGELPTAR